MVIEKAVIEKAVIEKLSSIKRMIRNISGPIIHRQIVVNRRIGFELGHL